MKHLLSNNDTSAVHGKNYDVVVPCRINNHAYHHPRLPICKNPDLIIIKSYPISPPPRRSDLPHSMPHKRAYENSRERREHQTMQAATRTNTPLRPVKYSPPPPGRRVTRPKQEIREK
mmetsp:Transcript_23792/g.57377  ORF Transcript_23792/g.57377 Transcript_23792/m.57377 type:complete len:118 (-) Transcript_23792:44-397(-)